jgi:hypothetical protein
MRWIACTSLVIVAACGGAAEQNKAATKAASIAAGQWELSSEVTAFTKADQGEPKINTPVGTRATESVCVAAGRPPAELFAGQGYECRYDNYYARNGRLNATLLCRREGLSGNIPITADGTFEADSLEYARDLRSSLAGDGDVQISTRVTGRRTGECTPEAPDTNQSNSADG